MKGFLLVALTCVSFAASVCHAQATWIECRGCNQFSAKDIAEQGMAPATRVLFDAGQNVAWKFDVVREQVGNNCQVSGMEGPRDDVGSGSVAEAQRGTEANRFGQCQWANVAYMGYLDGADAETLGHLHDLYVETDGTWKSSIEIGRDDITILPCGYCVEPSGSGYDVVNDMQFRNQVRDAVYDRMRTLSGALRSFDAIAMTGLEILLFGGDMTVTFVVVFADGTRVPVVFDASNKMGFIDKDRVTDEQGNELMTSSNVSEFQHFGEIYGLSTAAENFLRNAERLGVEIVRAGGGSGRQVSCTWKCEEISGQTICNLECSSH